VQIIALWGRSKRAVETISRIDPDVAEQLKQIPVQTRHLERVMQLLKEGSNDEKVAHSVTAGGLCSI